MFEAARALTGCSAIDIMEGMRAWPTEDPLLAAYYMVAKAHAVVVKPNRDARDRKWASARLTDYSKEGKSIDV